MATKPAVRHGSAERQPPRAPVGDIRSGRPWLLSPSPLRSFLRRILSVASLVYLDLAGLTLNVALILDADFDLFLDLGKQNGIVGERLRSATSAFA